MSHLLSADQCAGKSYCCRELDLLTALLGRDYAQIEQQGGLFYKAGGTLYPDSPPLEMWALLDRDRAIVAFEVRWDGRRTVFFTRDYIVMQLLAQNWRNGLLEESNAALPSATCALA